MPVPDQAAGEAMRRAYAAGTSTPSDWLARPLVVEPFGGPAKQANELLGLVRAGIKTATCSALCWYEAEGAALPAVGGLWAICDADGVPVCLVETTRVEVRRFADIDEAFARAEGEGTDRSSTGAGCTRRSSSPISVRSAWLPGRHCRWCASGSGWCSTRDHLAEPGTRTTRNAAANFGDAQQSHEAACGTQVVFAHLSQPTIGRGRVVLPYPKCLSFRGLWCEAVGSVGQGPSLELQRYSYAQVARSFFNLLPRATFGSGILECVGADPVNRQPRVPGPEQ